MKTAAIITLLSMLIVSLYDNRALCNRAQVARAERMVAEQQNVQIKRELLFLRIAECESSFKADARNGKCFGRYQFKEATFRWMSRRAGLSGDWRNPADQELLARWAMENGLQEHWQCYQIVISKWPELAIE